MTQRRTTIVTVDGKPATKVVIGRDLLDVDPIVEHTDARRAVAIMTQPGPPERIARALAGRLAESFQVAVLTLADRDDAKQLDQVDRAYHWLHEFGLGRSDAIVAVGGGAATDAAGFVAATYLRGVESVYVSTTVLGAVDASLGGKTGINHGGKNLVGAFWHPARVVIDLDVLDAAPDTVRREGFAEAVKTGFIADPVIVDLCERHGLAAPLDEIVPRSVAVKAGVVSDDFREADRRAFLNYGHTIGHAIEVVAGISHGDAVGTGMVAAAAVSERLMDFAHRRRHDEVIAGLGLPTMSPTDDRPAVEALISRDKKRDASGTRMVLLEDLGRPRLVPVSADDTRFGLGAIGIG